jgi:transposase
LAKDPSPLKVKEVRVKDRRYVVCLNESQARKDRHDREAIITKLRETLTQQGDKSLVGNKGFRRYVKKTGGTHFSIDEEKAKQEERFDGKWVLTTNTDLSAQDLALKYKQLWMVETIFRTMKSTLETRPVFHKCDDTIRGHVWCSFLALMLRKALDDRLERIRGEDDEALEWNDIVRDLCELSEMEIETGGKRFLLRTSAQGVAAKVFKACGVALPRTLTQLK